MMLTFTITMHKIQGSMLSCIVILCNDKYFASSQMYIIVNSIQKLNDLFLLEFDPKTFPSKFESSKFYQQLLSWIGDHDELNPNMTHNHPFPTSKLD